MPEDATLGTAILTRQPGKWYLVFLVEAAFAETCGAGIVGIDLGLDSLIATRDGETISAPRYARRARTSERRRRRQLARCRIGRRRSRMLGRTNPRGMLGPAVNETRREAPSRALTASLAPRRSSQGAGRLL